MRRNKLRIHLALYARPKHPGSYHYALFIAPKDARGSCTKHHVKNTLQIDGAGVASQPWRYEQMLVPDAGVEQRLLVRVIVAKVATDQDHVRRILESVPVYQVDDLDDAKARSFNCQTWVRDAYMQLEREGALTVGSETWEDAQRKALEYLDRKREQGRWSSTWKGSSGVPLMDLSTGKEVSG